MRLSKVNQPPVSQVRPKAASSRPDRADEPMHDFDRKVDALRVANEYDALRIAIELRKAEWETELKNVESRLISAMKASGEKNLATLHGRITFLAATAPSQTNDEDMAKELLATKGIPLPPTMQEWLSRHGIAMPMKSKGGFFDRLRFEKNK